jgi:hypothetical protein
MSKITARVMMLEIATGTKDFGIHRFPALPQSGDYLRIEGRTYYINVVEFVQEGGSTFQIEIWIK